VLQIKFLVIVLSFLVAMMFSSTTSLMYLKPDQSASVHSIPVNATSHGVEIDYLDCSILYQISLETAESLFP
jgi:hypothetical protein